MAMDKAWKAINRKLDLIMDELGIEDNEAEETTTAPAARELTPQEQDAINNAPKAEATIPPQERGPRVTAQNAPSTASSVPTVPQDAVGNVTVETTEPDGDVSVRTMPASEAKKGKK